jgi:hypothetical protein
MIPTSGKGLATEGAALAREAIATRLCVGGLAAGKDRAFHQTLAIQNE